MSHRFELAGCVENIYRKKDGVFADDGTQIGTVTAEFEVATEGVVQPGDIRYGCCVDAIIQPMGEGVYRMFEPVEPEWFNASTDKKYKYDHSLFIKFVPGWEDIIRTSLKPKNAEFVFDQEGM